ncbi:kinase-like domain-containing protein [Lasiosphaeris hirsuta]|uniref:Kinase-like domain-containing protein n=1 Tax=Lasiosphaeris hirsuta TaxID=260670 RepID=A0AA40AY65_9PEZI|nr:kinase-like domain-containing protein [Lasiosphaeris hirsuta]
MSEPTITSKDDVECTVFVDPKDSSIQVGARYFRWVLGSHRADSGALGQVPGESIFPPLPIPWWFASTGVTVNDSWDTEPGPDIYYLKRPWLAGYDADHDAATNMPSRLAQWFACEIKRLEQLVRHATHPNLVHYHGCRVRNGRITAAILGHVPGDTLMNYAKAGKKIQDKEAFLRALASAVHHLHNVAGLVHNDIQPTNIMVSPDGTTPTLIDLGSAWSEGEEIIRCPVPSCWGNDPLDMDPETFFNGPLTGEAHDMATPPWREPPS